MAREIAGELSKRYGIFGVTRHQLYVHESIPFTSHNSCAVIHVEDRHQAEMDDIFDTAKDLMLSDFVEGSDPGIAIASSHQVTYGVTAFGIDAKKIVLNQDRARKVAKNAGIRLEGLGGTEGGVIGAVAGIGLAAIKNDGRFLLKGGNRDLTGVLNVRDILCAGIDHIMTLDGRVLTDGNIDVGKSKTPSFVQGKAVLFVDECDGRLVALKRD
nr:ABC transporter substrate-binding protein [Methanocella sp. CWC-04]